MAITFITGVARSGKSYFSTHYLYQMYKNRVPKKHTFSFITQWINLFIAKPHKYYETVYTNINKFNFDFHPRIRPFKFDELVDKLTIVHDLHINEHKDDDYLIEKCKELEIYNCLFIIDEAAHHFTKPVNKVLVWWLTYHGHLYHDIHLITQHMKQIPDEYLKNGEYFYKAAPPKNAIWKRKISYGEYENAGFYKNGRNKGFSVPIVPEVYNLYVSGKIPERKPILKKFIFIFIFLIFMLYSAFAYFKDSTLSEEAKARLADIESNQSSQFIEEIEVKEESNFKENKKLDYKKINQSLDEDIDLEELTFVTFKCINKVCLTKDYENIPLSFVNFLKQNNELVYEETTNKIYSYSTFSFLLDSSSIDILSRSFSALKSKDKEEKKQSSIPSLM